MTWCWWIVYFYFCRLKLELLTQIPASSLNWFIWSTEHLPQSISSLLMTFYLIFNFIRTVYLQVQLGLTVIFSCRWKLHEGAMLALGSIRNLIIESVKKEKIQFDLQGILQTVVLADLNQNGMFDGFWLECCITFLSSIWSWFFWHSSQFYSV